MAATCDLLLDVLRRPATMVALALPEWDLLLQQARVTGVLSRLAVQAESLGHLDQVPEQVHAHLLAARVVAESQERMVRWEVNRIQRALSGISTPIILLKGAGYVTAGLKTAEGRLCCDIDILLPEEKLGVVEQALIAHGWEVAEQNPLHERYFRRWLHELPPLQHRERKTLVDVHHTILPRTDRLRVDPQLLFDDAVSINGSGLKVLAPADMALHSAAHLFRNGDFSLGLRDLCDLDSLLRHFGDAADFWDRLVARAVRLDLVIPCFYALRYVERYLGTPVPERVKDVVRTWQPVWPAPRLIDALVDRALLPRRLDGADRSRNLAIWLLAYWPLPRIRAMASGLFWAKRLPSLAAKR